jgi:hypothetical protein
MPERKFMTKRVSNRGVNIGDLAVKQMGVKSFQNFLKQPHIIFAWEKR